MTKVCKHCNRELSIDEFYVSKKYSGKVYDTCKECYRIKWKIAYKKRRVEILEKQLKYRLANKEKNKEKTSNYYQANKEKIKLRAKNRYLENIREHSARCKAYYAVKIGKILKKPCEICGLEKVQAHHEDYDKPLEVFWLCSRHHKHLHTGIIPLPRLNEIINI